MAKSTYVVIGHDGFSRTFTIRRQVEYNNKGTQGCDECGGLNKFGKLFQYGTQPEDSLRLHWQQGAFCSQGCAHAYHGL
jgi:hypothetical protein